MVIDTDTTDESPTWGFAGISCCLLALLSFGFEFTHSSLEESHREDSPVSVLKNLPECQKETGGNLVAQDNKGGRCISRYLVAGLNYVLIKLPKSNPDMYCKTIYIPEIVSHFGAITTYCVFFLRKVWDRSSKSSL